MYRKVGKYQTKQQQRVKKSTGCHGQKERMEETSGLDKLTLCKILPWFTFVSVQEIVCTSVKDLQSAVDLRV